MASSVLEARHLELMMLLQLLTMIIVADGDNGKLNWRRCFSSHGCLSVELSALMARVSSHVRSGEVGARLKVFDKTPTIHPLGRSPLKLQKGSG